jgi:fucose permease
MLLTASTELGTNQWIATLLSNIGVQGILILVLINGIMAVGRMFGGPVGKSLSPAGMLLFSAIFSAVGLFWLSSSSGNAALAAAAVFAVGITYFWPTMLGFIALYVPRSGALGLAILGGIGAGATAIAQPFLGWVYDTQLERHLPAGTTVQALQAAAEGTAEHAQWLEVQVASGSGALQTMAVLPVILIVAFGGLYAWQKGKSPERLSRRG